MFESRLAITGIGVVSPAGMGAQEFFTALAEGGKFTKRIDLFDPSSFACQAGGQLDNFSARKHVPKSYRKAVKVMARDIEIAVVAADQAIRDAGLETPGTDSENSTYPPKRLACNIGAGLVCTDLDELGDAVTMAVTDGKFDFKKWGETGINHLTPLWLLKYLPNMLSCHVTIIHDAEGPSNCLTCGAVSAQLSIGEAGTWIAEGRADVAIAGGAESKLNPMGTMRQEKLGRLCTNNDDHATMCRPFDVSHAGTVVGEGGGLLIIENMDMAIERGAKIYAELVGFGAACDPAGMFVDKPSCGSLDLAVTKAIAHAGITADQIDLIVTQGTGVPADDKSEAQAWLAALGSKGSEVPAFAITGAVGSSFAGAGGLSAAAAVLAVHNQLVPPTANFSAPAEGCELNLSSQARPADINYAVVGGFSLAGQSGACVLKRYEP